MNPWLRRLIQFNAAIWLGGLIVGGFLLLPILFSNEARQWVNSRYHLGMIAQVFVRKLTLLNLVCGSVALVGNVLRPARHVREDRFGNIAIGVVMLVSIASILWLQPKMSAWHLQKYATNVPEAVGKAAAASFGIWHGVSQVFNLLAIGVVVIHFWRSTRPPVLETSRIPRDYFR